MAAAARPTIEDVARRAGVGRGTVSRVLNGGSVAARSRERVEAAIAATGYRVSAAARSLASGRAGAITALLSEPYDELFGDPTFASLLQGIASELSGTDFALNLLVATDEDERARAAAQLHPGRVDGIILLSPHLSEPILDVIARDVPVVACSSARLDRALAWTVAIDDREGGRQGAQRLLERGCRRIAVIGGPADAVGALARVEGQRDALGDAFDEERLVHMPYSSRGGAEAMQRLLAHAPDIDGVLCASDRQALGALRILHEDGRRIPEDVAVVGFDDHAIAAETTPALTTVSHPIGQVGAAAARLLLEHLAGGAPQSLTLGTSLVVRDSA